MLSVGCQECSSQDDPSCLAGAGSAHHPPQPGSCAGARRVLDQVTNECSEWSVWSPRLCNGKMNVIIVNSPLLFGIKTVQQNIETLIIAFINLRLWICCPVWVVCIEFKFEVEVVNYSRSYSKLTVIHY